MATSEDVKEVLRHLLNKLQDPHSRHYERYSDWVERHPELEKFLFGRLKPSFLYYLERSVQSINTVKSIDGDLNFQGRAIYLHSIVGLDNKTRIYVGQSYRLSTRLWRQHLNFRYRRDNRSLHYHALQNSTFDVFAVCAILPSSLDTEAPEMDEPQLVMNVLEMYCALLLRTLPRKLLLQYLPPGSKVPIGPPDGLNIGCPLDHGLPYKSQEWIDLSDSQDPLVLQYIGKGRKELPIETTPPEVKTPDYTTEPGEVSGIPPLLIFGVLAIAGIFILRNARR